MCFIQILSISIVMIIQVHKTVPCLHLNNMKNYAHSVNGTGKQGLFSDQWFNTDWHFYRTFTEVIQMQFESWQDTQIVNTNIPISASCISITRAPLAVRFSWHPQSVWTRRWKMTANLSSCVSNPVSCNAKIMLKVVNEHIPEINCESSNCVGRIKLFWHWAILTIWLACFSYGFGFLENFCGHAWNFKKAPKALSKKIDYPEEKNIKTDHAYTEQVGWHFFYQKRSQKWVFLVC